MLGLSHWRPKEVCIQCLCSGRLVPERGQGSDNESMVLVPPQPLSARVLSHDCAARLPPLLAIPLHLNSPAVTYTIPPTPWMTCVCGGGRLNYNLQHTRLFHSCKQRRGGPRHTFWPRHTLYEGGISSKGPSFGRATHTNKLHTGTSMLIWWRVGIALYICLFAESILLTGVVCAAFSCRGAKG